MGDDQGAGAVAQHIGRFGEDELDDARVLLGRLGERDGAGRRRDGAQIDHAAFRLGDDLLRHHQYVAGRETAIGCAQGGKDDGGEIVPRLNDGNAAQGRENELVEVGVGHDRVHAVHPSFETRARARSSG